MAITKKAPATKKALTIVEAGDPSLNPATEFLTTAEAAAIIGVSKGTLSAYRKKSRGPAYYQDGRAIRYARADVETYAAEHTNGLTFNVDKAKRVEPKVKS